MEHHLMETFSTPSPPPHFTSFPAQAKRITNDFLHKHHPRIKQRFIEVSRGRSIYVAFHSQPLVFPYPHPRRLAR